MTPMPTNAGAIVGDSRTQTEAEDSIHAGAPLNHDHVDANQRKRNGRRLRDFRANDSSRAIFPRDDSPVQLLHRHRVDPLDALDKLAVLLGQAHERRSVFVLQHIGDLSMIKLPLGD